MKYFVDTHLLVWRLIDPRQLSKKERAIFSGAQAEFLIPTVVLLEMQYLSEIKRIEIDLDEALMTIQEDSSFQLVPFDEAAMLHAFRLTTTRDPFDRIILSQALASGTKILTRDRWMKETAPHLVVV